MATLKFKIESLVRQMIREADQRDFCPQKVFDTEEVVDIFNLKTSAQVIEITATDMANVTFVDSHDNQIVLVLVFDNQPSEMIIDYTDNLPAASEIATAVAEHFEAMGW